MIKQQPRLFILHPVLVQSLSQEESFLFESVLPAAPGKKNKQEQTRLLAFCLA